MFEFYSKLFKIQEPEPTQWHICLKLFLFLIGKDRRTSLYISVRKRDYIHNFSKITLAPLVKRNDVCGQVTKTFIHPLTFSGRTTSILSCNPSVCSLGAFVDMGSLRNKLLTDPGDYNRFFPLSCCSPSSFKPVND